jgi:hypothetical protein
MPSAKSKRFSPFSLDAINCLMSDVGDEAPWPRRRVRTAFRLGQRAPMEN